MPTNEGLPGLYVWDGVEGHFSFWNFYQIEKPSGPPFLCCTVTQYRLSWQDVVLHEAIWLID